MNFDHVGVLVEDLEAAKTFARDLLGIGEPVGEFEAPDEGLAGAFFDLGDGRLELFTLTQPRAFGLDHVAVSVDDIDAEQERLAAKGVRFTGPMLPDHIDTPVDLRGARHLWTDPATSGGFRVQLIGAKPQESTDEVGRDVEKPA